MDHARQSSYNVRGCIEQILIFFKSIKILSPFFTVFKYKNWFTLIIIARAKIFLFFYQLFFIIIWR
jgi:hypothetical protein